MKSPTSFRPSGQATKAKFLLLNLVIQVGHLVTLAHALTFKLREGSPFRSVDHSPNKPWVF